MDKHMINDEALTFKEFEKKTFEIACRWARDFTGAFLEKYDAEATGQDISAAGVWNVIQALGEEACRDEKGLLFQWSQRWVYVKMVDGEFFEKLYLSLLTIR